mmetsp:Transcript_5728/g.14316  ORF Transcript_5728/g.14316 Transcript_5728/m.14316 type:complete len:224 (+) Transcript_5728:335-1006(+)
MGACMTPPSNKGAGACVATQPPSTSSRAAFPGWRTQCSQIRGRILSPRPRRCYHRRDACASRCPSWPRSPACWPRSARQQSWSQLFLRWWLRQNPPLCRGPCRRRQGRRQRRQLIVWRCRPLQAEASGSGPSPGPRSFRPCCHPPLQFQHGPKRCHRHPTHFPRSPTYCHSHHASCQRPWTTCPSRALPYPRTDRAAAPPNCRTCCHAGAAPSPPRSARCSSS